MSEYDYSDGLVDSALYLYDKLSTVKTCTCVLDDFGNIQGSFNIPVSPDSMEDLVYKLRTVLNTIRFFSVDLLGSKPLISTTLVFKVKRVSDSGDETDERICRSGCLNTDLSNIDTILSCLDEILDGCFPYSILVTTTHKCYSDYICMSPFKLITKSNSYEFLKVLSSIGLLSARLNMANKAFPSSCIVSTEGLFRNEMSRFKDYLFCDLNLKPAYSIGDYWVFPTNSLIHLKPNPLYFK